MVLDGPLYARPVHIEGGAPAELEGQPGQKAGERWWTIRVRQAAAKAAEKKEPTKKERAALKKSFYQSMIAD